MTFSLSPAANRTHFSASQMNEYSAGLLQLYAASVAPRYLFYQKPGSSDGANPSGEWEGYIMHTADIFRWATYTDAGDNIIVDYGGHTIVDTAVNGTAGTIDISSYGFQVGSVYYLHTHYYGSGTVYWLGEVKTESYSAPPAFSTGGTLTADNLETLRTCMLTMSTLAEMPAGPSEHQKISNSIYGHSAASPGHIYMANAAFVYTGADTLDYGFEHGSNNGQVNTTFYIDGSAVLGIGEVSGGITHYGTVDLAGSIGSFTIGSIHELQVVTKVENTAKKVPTYCELKYLSFESTYAPSAPPIWAHGGTNINQTNLEWYSDTIKALWNGSGSEECVLLYEYPAVRRNNRATHVTKYNSFYIQHRHKWLKYLAVDGITPSLYYSNQTVSLEAEDNLHIFDVDQISGMTYGEFYRVDGVFYAAESLTE